MYLDTDIILALIKKEDWLKEYVSIDKLKNAKTSALTIIEARLILAREYSREEAIKALSEIEKLRILVFPVDKKILEKSNQLMRTYEKLGIFDAVHAASAIVKQEELISTDTIFKTLPEVSSKDPREM